MKNGALVISLDFELLWGVFDKVDWCEKKEYFQNTRKLIPEILEFFNRYEISGTWATVGMLFNENWDEWNQNIPAILPEYYNEKLSAYKFGKSIQSKETEGICFAPELIKLIMNTEGQEIGTHTYSHYYCLEAGQTQDSFRADLITSRKLAENFGINLNSLVFPRNQFNPDYLGICKELKIFNVRTNPKNWYWKDAGTHGLAQKIFRTGDAYIGLNDKSYKIEGIYENKSKLIKQKSSRLLRPYSSNPVFNGLKLKRILLEMETAARKCEIYHLWWHPHNFGDNPSKNLRDLKIILEHYKKLKNKYNFKSITMDDLRIYFQ